MGIPRSVTSYLVAGINISEALKRNEAPKRTELFASGARLAKGRSVSKAATYETVKASLELLKQQVQSIQDRSDDAEVNRAIREGRNGLLDESLTYFEKGDLVASMQILSMLKAYLPREDAADKKLVTQLENILTSINTLAYENLRRSPEFKVVEPRSEAIRNAVQQEAEDTKLPTRNVKPLEEGDIHVLPSDMEALEEYVEDQTDPVLKSRLEQMLSGIKTKAKPNMFPDVGFENQLLERARHLKLAAAIGGGDIFAHYMLFVPGFGRIRLLDYRLAQFSHAANSFESLKLILIQSVLTKSRVVSGLREGRADLSPFIGDASIEYVNSGLSYAYKLGDGEKGAIWKEGDVFGLTVPSNGDAVLQLWQILDDLLEAGYQYYSFNNVNVVNSVPNPRMVAYLDYLREQAEQKGKQPPWVLFMMTLPIKESGGFGVRGVYSQYEDNQTGIRQILEQLMATDATKEAIRSNPQDYFAFNTNTGDVHLRRSYLSKNPEALEAEIIPALRNSVENFGDRDPKNKLRTDFEVKRDPDDIQQKNEIAQVSTIFGSLAKMDPNVIFTMVPRDEKGDYLEFKERDKIENLTASIRRFSQNGLLALKSGEESNNGLSRDDLISWFLEDDIAGRVTGYRGYNYGIVIADEKGGIKRYDQLSSEHRSEERRVLYSLDKDGFYEIPEVDGANFTVTIRQIGARLSSSLDWLKQNTPSLEGQTVVEASMEIALSRAILENLSQRLKAGGIRGSRHDQEMRKAAMDTSVGGIGPLVPERMQAMADLGANVIGVSFLRSEERRVGKEC